MGSETQLRAPGPAGGGSSDFDLTPQVLRPDNRVLRPAAVLIAVQDGQVVLTKRSSKLQHHPGQIAFPGGKLDPDDAGPVAAALREAHEEVGLPPDIVSVRGVFPPHETVTGFAVTPVLAEITARFDPVPEVGEVDEVFMVPLAFLMDRANFRVEGRLWRGQRRLYYVIPYGPYYIWGATARILRRLAEEGQTP